MKRFIAMILSLAMVVSVIGCGASSQEETSPESTSAEAENETEEADNGEEIELVWATFKTDWVDTLENVIFPEYEKEHPGIKVSVYTAESGDLFGDLKALQASGNLPNIFNMRGDDFGYEYKDLLQDVSDSAAVANVMDGMTDGFEWDGGIYGAYYNYEIHGIIWNKAALADVGITSVPVTKTECFDAFEKLYAAGYMGLSYLQTAQVLHNHMGNAPLVLGGENASERYKGLVDGTIDPTTDVYWNEFFDFLNDMMKYADPESISYDQNVMVEKVFPGNSGYGWEFEYGTTGIYYKYDTNFTEEWEIGPFCIDDENSYFIQNCQGYVVSNQGTEEENAAALDLYNWWYTSDFVAETLVKEFSVITTSKSYVPEPEVYDTYTYDAYMMIQDGFACHPITYYMGSDLCASYAAVIQKMLDDALPEYGKEEALNEVGELFRAQQK